MAMVDLSKKASAEMELKRVKKASIALDGHEIRISETSEDLM